MFSLRPRGLWLHIAIPVLAFVALGSLLIVLLLHSEAQRESRELFAALARTTANLIRGTQIEPTTNAAAELSRALGLQVFFRRSAWDVSTGEGKAMSVRQTTELIPAPMGSLGDNRVVLDRLQPQEGVVHAGRKFEAIAIPVDEAATLLLVRAVEPASTLLLRPVTVGVLVLFWLVSIALTWAITRGVVHPLRQLTSFLPEIVTETRTMPPGFERSDEIGQLSRAFLETQALLKNERKQRAANERLAVLGKMATGLAHEIHNPLSAIRLHAQLLDSATGAELAETARQTLPILLEETARIEGLVNQWMFLARPVPPQVSRTDAGELVDRVVAAHLAIAHHSDVQIETQLEPSLVANLDSRRFTQAIRNVIVNAIHAMSNGGTLRIEGKKDGGNVRLNFIDTGPGFSATALSRHSELFYSEKEGGMGIGLSVTLEILKAHRGVLSVANGPTGGAIVSFLIPAV